MCVFACLRVCVCVCVTTIIIEEEIMNLRQSGNLGSAGMDKGYAGKFYFNMIQARVIRKERNSTGKNASIRANCWVFS